MGERDHNRMQLLIGAWFLNHEKTWNVEATTEQRTRITLTRVRVPDIFVVRRDVPLEQVMVTPPLLCIEVMSPEDRVARTTKVLDDYAVMGVQHLWIVDPYERVAYIYQTGGKLQLVTDRLAVPKPQSISTCQTLRRPRLASEAGCPILASLSYAMEGAGC